MPMKDPDRYLPDPGHEDTTTCQTCLGADVEDVDDPDCDECRRCREDREHDSAANDCDGQAP